MIYFIRGMLTAKSGNFVVIETGGVGYKIFVSELVRRAMPKVGGEVKLFTYHYLREDAAHLYGFLASDDLETFELLNSVSGIGPKTAMGIMNLTTTANLLAAIKEGRAELLTKASGIGRKTAARLILELREKIKSGESKELLSAMESDADVLSALVNLGYDARSAKEAIMKVAPETQGVPARLKEALRLLKKS